MKYSLCAATAWLLVFSFAMPLSAQRGLPMPVTWGSVQSVRMAFVGPGRSDFLQAGAPLLVIGSSCGELDFFARVWLVNVSERTIVKYQLGWVVGDRERPGPGTPFLAQAFDIILKPWEVERTGRQGANFSDVIELLKSEGIRNGVVTVGVVYVKFEDGTEWSYPLTGRGRFESEYNPELQRKLDPILKKVGEEIKELIKAEPAAPTSSATRPGIFARVLTWARNFFSLPRVWASPEDCLWLVCNPGLAYCESGGKWCSRWPCDLGGCGFADCGAIPWPCYD